MAKRSNVKSNRELNREVENNSEVGEVNLEIISEVSDIAVVSEPEYVQIRSMTDGKKTITGSVTGEVYIFSGAGSIQLVRVEDSEHLLEKRRRSCCGTGAVTKFFELVGG